MKPVSRRIVTFVLCLALVMHACEALGTKTLSDSETQTISGSDGAELSMSETSSPSEEISLSLSDSLSLSETLSPSEELSMSKSDGSLSLSVSHSPSEEWSMSLSVSPAPTATNTFPPTNTASSTISFSVSDRTSSQTVSFSVSDSRSVGSLSLSHSISRDTDSSSISASGTRSQTDSSSISDSVTKTQTTPPTETDSFSKSASNSLSVSTSITRTTSGTTTVTPANTPSAEATSSYRESHSQSTKSFTRSITPSVTPSTSDTLTQTHSLSPSKSETPSETFSSTRTPSLSLTSSLTSSSTDTATGTISPSPAATATPPQTISITKPLTATKSLSPSTTHSDTSSPSKSGSKSLSLSYSSTKSRSSSSSFSSSSSSSLTPSTSKTQTVSASWTPSLSSTSSPSNTRVTKSPTALNISVSAAKTATETHSPRSPSLTSTITGDPLESFTPSLSLTPTLSFTPTLSKSATDTSSPSFSETHTSSQTEPQSTTETSSLSRTTTRSRTDSSSRSETSTQTTSFSSSKSRSGTLTSTATVSPPDTRTMTFTPSQSFSQSMTMTDTITPAPTPSITHSVSHSLTTTITPPPTESMTHSHSSSLTQTMSLSPSPTITATVTPPPTSTESPTPSETKSLSLTASQTLSPSETKSPSFTRSATDSHSLTPSKTPTVSPTMSETFSVSLSESSTLSLSPTATLPPTPTPSLELTATESESLTESATVTPPPTETATYTVTITPAPTETAAETLTPTLSYTDPTETESESNSETLTLSDNSFSLSVSASMSLSVSKSGPELELVSPPYPRPVEDSHIPFRYGAGTLPEVPSTARGRRQAAADGDDPYFFFPKLFLKGVRTGEPLVQRQLVFALHGGEFDLEAAAADEAGRFFYRCITLDTSLAPSIETRAFYLWTPGTISSVNLTRLTITFPVDSDFSFPSASSPPEVFQVRFAPHCFKGHQTPSPHTYTIVMMNDPSATAAPTAVISEDAEQAADVGGTVAVTTSSALGSPAIGQYLSRTVAAMNMLLCHELDTRLTFFEHPTGLDFLPTQDGGFLLASDLKGDDVRLAHFFGALVMNLAIAIVIMLIHFGVGLLAQKIKDGKVKKMLKESGRSLDAYANSKLTTGKWIARAMSLVGFPSKSVWLLLLFPPAVKCTLVLIFTSGQPATITFTVLTFLPWLAFVIWVAFCAIRATTRVQYYNERQIEDHRRRLAQARNHYGNNAVQWALYTGDSKKRHGGADASTVADGPLPPGALRDDRTINEILEDVTMLQKAQTGAATPAGGENPSDARAQIFDDLDRNPPKKKDSAIFRFFSPRGAWRDKRSDLQTVRTGLSYQSVFGNFFEDYRAHKYRGFLLFELLVAALCAILDGLAIALGLCQPFLILLFIIVLIHLIVLLYHRPYDVQGNNVFFILLAACQLVIITVALVGSGQADDSPEKRRTTEIAMVMLLVLQWALLARAVADIISIGYEVWNKFALGEYEVTTDNEQDEIDYQRRRAALAKRRRTSGGEFTSSEGSIFGGGAAVGYGGGKELSPHTSSGGSDPIELEMMAVAPQNLHHHAIAPHGQQHYGQVLPEQSGYVPATAAEALLTELPRLHTDADGSLSAQPPALHGDHFHTPERESRALPPIPNPHVRSGSSNASPQPEDPTTHQTSRRQVSFQAGEEELLPPVPPIMLQQKGKGRGEEGMRDVSQPMRLASVGSAPRTSQEAIDRRRAEKRARRKAEREALEGQGGYQERYEEDPADPFGAMDGDDGTIESSTHWEYDPEELEIDPHTAYNSHRNVTNWFGPGPRSRHRSRGFGGANHNGGLHAQSIADDIDAIQYGISPPRAPTVPPPLSGSDVAGVISSSPLAVRRPGSGLGSGYSQNQLHAARGGKQSQPKDDLAHLL